MFGLLPVKFITGSSPVQAATGSISFDGTGIPGTTCGDSIVLFTGAPFGDTVDTTRNGVDYDYVALVLVDATGQMLFAGYDTFPMGANSVPGGLPLYYNISARPVTIAMFDVDNGIENVVGPGGIVTNPSVFFNYVIANGILIAQNSIDPVTIGLSACSGLPLLSPFTFPGGGSAGGGGTGGGGSSGGNNNSSSESTDESSDVSRPFVPGDQRLNAQAGASATVYCQENGSIYVYGINELGRGFFSFQVSRDRVEEVGIPATNTMLASGLGTWGDISLWRLTSGEFQLHAPGLPPETAKPYDFVFEGCAI
jgi:hypothetical protein